MKVQSNAQICKWKFALLKEIVSNNLQFFVLCRTKGARSKCFYQWLYFTKKNYVQFANKMFAV